MGGDYPDWHPLSTIVDHADPCSCEGKPDIVLGSVAGAVGNFCAECDGYVE